MFLPTYGELVKNVEEQLDLQGEVFIRPDEMLANFNEAVDDIEADIHTIYEDYFLVPELGINIVSGQSDYALPNDIYAQKIRKIFFNQGSDKYEIRYVREPNEVLYTQENEYYRYRLFNTTENGVFIRLYPTPNFTDNVSISIEYLRNMKRFTGDITQKCDIPEFSYVLSQYAKWRCLEKEIHPNAPAAEQRLEMMRKRMQDTLTCRRVDDDNKITPDFQHYWDSNFSDWGGYYG